MLSRVSAFVMLLCCLSAFVCAGESPAWEKAWREPLSHPVSVNYLKQWLVCGPFEVTPAMPASTDFLTAVGGESAVQPKDGMAITRPDGSTVTWKACEVTTDYINFTPLFGGKPQMNTIAYAYTTINRPQAGKAYLAAASDDGISIWLNGKLIHRRIMTRGMFPDNDLIQIDFQAGENHILVKVEQAIEFWAFMLRIVEDEEAARLQPQREMPTRLWPAVIRDTDANTLAIATDCGWDVPPRLQTPVEVTVTGIGGALIARQTVPYRQQAVFNVTKWTDGPYDLACTMTRADGKALAARRSWYKGDALAATRQILDTAPPRTSDKPDDLIHNLLVDIITSRLGEKLQSAGAGSMEFVYPLLMDFAEMRQEQAGGVGPRHGSSLVRLAYRDETDASPQFARAYLPQRYDPAKKWPMIVVLHGSQPGNPLYINSLGAWWRFDTLYDDCGAIMLYPNGRGNISYRGAGENDILKCIALAKARLSIDDDRVYLTGGSMGGSGTWLIGTHYPELFAAIASVYGGWDYRVTDDQKEIDAMSPAERFRTECGGTFAQLDSLRTTPVFSTHGERDGTVPVGNSRYAVSQLQRWGYDVRYWEVAGKGHEPLGTEYFINDWLLQHRRDANPRRVSLRSGELKFAAAHWVRIDQRQEQLAFMQADAEIIAPNAIRLDTENVRALTLSPKHPLIDPAKPVRIIWNGTELRNEQMTNGRITLRVAGYTPTPDEKRATLEGPISDAQAQPFAIVIGTTSLDPLMRELCVVRARELIQSWERRLHWTPRVFPDIAMSDPDIARYSLLLIGGPADNLVTRKLADKLPLTIAADGITLVGKHIAARDAVMQMVYPHPLNPERYVVVVAATSAAGMYQVNRLRNDVDFEVLDAHRTFVARGAFDHSWHMQDRYTEFGDEKLRAAEPLRKAPTLATALFAGNRLPISAVLEKSADGAFREMIRDANMDGRQFRLGTRTFDTGLAIPLQWNGAVEYDITNANWTQFHTVLGLELAPKRATTKAQRDGVKVLLTVKGDGKVLASATFTADAKPQSLNLDITGVKTLRLEMSNQGADDAPVVSIDWADAYLKR